MDAMRAMLDELMGKERNQPLDARNTKHLTWDDPGVCKYQLCGPCPSKLFKNTKSDLGPCEFEYHDDHLEWPRIKEDYEKADPRMKERYERKLMRYLEDLIREMDRKIAKNKERAAKESAPRELRAEDQIRLSEIQGRAKDASMKAERLAEEGEVDQAMLLQNQAEMYSRQHEELRKKLTIPEKTMLVCDICGVFINSTDNDQRRRANQGPSWVMDHLEGKQYLGWKAIRERYAELLAKYGAGGGRDFSYPPPSSRSADRPARAGSSERERGSSRDYDRDKEKERERRHREYDRERERERERRSRDRDRERDRDRDFQLPSRDRVRSRERGEYDRRRY